MMAIPVTIAICERSFIQLMLKKTYFRSIVTEERLNNFSLISIENDIVTRLDLNEAITSIAD